MTQRVDIARRTQTLYTYDHRNRLVSVSEVGSNGSATSRIEYQYDAYNRLVSRYNVAGVGAPTRLYWSYDTGINPVLEFDISKNPTLTHRYLWSNSVDDLLADENVTSLSSGGNTLWGLADHLGTIRDIADANEATGVTSVVNHRRYNAFGKLMSQSGVVGMIFGYTGKYSDAATGLQNNLNRWYDPNLGKWISQDPIGFGGGDGNLYRYVGNSPTNGTDPSGLIVPNDGHHILPWSIFTNAGFSDDIQDYFNSDNARLRDDLYKSHNGARVRGISEFDYRKEVQGIFDEFMSGRDPAKLTRRQAESLIGKIRDSENPIIRNYLEGVTAEIKLAKETANAFVRKAKRAGKSVDDALWREAREHAHEVVKLTRKGITARILSKISSSRATKAIGGFLGFYTIASDGNVTGAELSRTCADITPIGWSIMAGESLGEATEYFQDEIERTAELNRTSPKLWMKSEGSRPVCND